MIHTQTHNKMEVVKGNTVDAMYNKWCEDFNNTITEAQGTELLRIKNKSGLNALKIEDSKVVTGWTGKRYDKTYFVIELNGSNYSYGK